MPLSLQTVTASPIGGFLVLAVAAWLEVQGDACFQSGLYHSQGTRRVLWFALGTAVLAGYSLLLNASRVDFGRLLGLYVVLFFLVAQGVAKLQFHQTLGKPVYVGGALVVAGGLVMTFWKSA